MFHESDFSQNLELVTSRDLEFSKNADGDEGCLVRFWDRPKQRSILFLLFRDSAGYTLAQSVAPNSIDLHEDACEYLRDPRVFKQDYKLPAALPVSAPYLGPMIHVNMMRILRVAQARLLDNAPVKEDALHWLHVYYEEESVSSQPQQSRDATILTFPRKKPEKTFHFN